jgi:hypothetical protein
MVSMLPEIVENEAEKLVSPNIQSDIRGIQRKKNGKIEHYDGGHDDNLMAYLIFRYAVFHGTCFRDRFGISAVPTTTNVKVVSSSANIARIESLIRDANLMADTNISNNEYLAFANDFNRKNGNSSASLGMF